MASITLGDTTIEVPDIEVLAAFRQSFRTADREGFPRTAKQVLSYLQPLEAADRRQRYPELYVFTTHDGDEVTLFTASESIARGDECLGCGQVWTWTREFGSTLLHKPGCSYIAACNREEADQEKREQELANS